jgi:hypothetical protein
MAFDMLGLSIGDGAESTREWSPGIHESSRSEM